MDDIGLASAFVAQRFDVVNRPLAWYESSRFECEHGATMAEIIIEMDEQKSMASDWFRSLRDEICSAFELLEDQQTTGPHAAIPPGRFGVKKTQRLAAGGSSDGGGGLMSVMRGGRVFEKVGVNISTVYGSLDERAQKSLTSRRDFPGLGDDPKFWASGISLVAHMNSPKCPAVHMNTRMFWTPGCWWFGGGADLNPMVAVDEDTKFFHDILKTHCDRHDAAFYPKFTKWAEEYFFITHRAEERGVGGIFFDDLNTGNWAADFSFVQDVGRAFLAAFLPLTVAHRDEGWTDADRDTQLVKRGRYAEFNLIYDRGTKFGLESGHDPEAVLMSLPPVAKWP